MGYIYICCLDRKCCHSSHYLGSADDVISRIQSHLECSGSKFLAAAIVKYEAGGTFYVFEVENHRKVESIIKKHKNNSRYCPHCNPGGYNAVIERISKLDISITEAAA